MIIATKATASGMRTPRTMGSVVLSVELADRSQGPVVSLGPHDVKVLDEPEFVEVEGSLATSEGARSSKSPSSRMSGIGPGLA